MTIVTANGIRRSFGDRDVLADVSLAIAAGERIGLVGRNGSGKTTLAKILAGHDEPDAGQVVRRVDLRIGYLSQAPALPPGASVVDAVLGGRSDWCAAFDRHVAISDALERGDGDLTALLAEQATAAAEVERLGGWTLRHEAAGVLDHLGMRKLDAIVDALSGGEQRRVALARILVAQPELAILDEPTNHLDADAIEWLERWLVERFRGALVVVTHDRYLLDRVVQRTLEIDAGRVHDYEGGWARYLEAKAERDALEERTEANRRNYLRRELEWLRRSPKARTTKQKARIDRIEAVADRPAARSDNVASIAVGHVRSGDTILEAHDVAVDVAGRRLVEGLTLQLSRGERIGIVGPNGCGKTSLLQVLVGARPPSHGHVRHGVNTKIAVLDQLRSGLRDEATVFDNVADGRTRIAIGDDSLEVRAYLERFLFSPNEQRKRVATLSGGERARVALARTLSEKTNLVVLDEPTNDLDVVTLAAFEEALLGFSGTVLVVTHDRWFLDRIATSVLTFDDQRLLHTQGGWTDALEARRRNASVEIEPPAVAPRPAATRTRPRNKLTWAEERELDGLLDRVDAAETELAALEATAADPRFYQRADAERREHFAAIERARAEAHALAARWAELEERRGAS